MSVDKEMYGRFEDKFREGLTKICRSAGLMDGEWLWSEDFESAWEKYARDYVADAVENFNSYPDAAIAWAAYLGMGVAVEWDRDWTEGRQLPYMHYYGSRGWDDMDEHVVRDLLGLPLDSPAARKLTEVYLSCSAAILGLLRYEGVETQTTDGFFILGRAYYVMYCLGVSIALRTLGYKSMLFPSGPAA